MFWLGHLREWVGRFGFYVYVDSWPGLQVHTLL